MVDNSRAVVRAEPNVFLAFDRLDDDQIVAEMKGAALNEYVYEFTEGGQTVRGLSKVGTDDAARIMAVKYGEALREVDCWLERDDDEAAYFKAKVTRFIIKDDGTAIEMDTAIGHKRQPKATVLRSGMVKANPFWYEQGAQKALRNAKQKMMPETIKQAIIAMYVQQGKVRQVRADEVAGIAQQPQRPASAATAKPTPTQPEKPPTDPAPAAAPTQTMGHGEQMFEMLTTYGVLFNKGKRMGITGLPVASNTMTLSEISVLIDNATALIEQAEAKQPAKGK